MKFEHLHYFLETARFQHIGKAAKSIAISPSAISHAIANLEQEFGIQLFAKRGKNIFLSEDGKSFQVQARKLVAEYENLRLISTHPLSMKGHLRLASSHMIGGMELPSVLNSILKENPLLTIELLSLRSADVVKEVLSGRIDLGICFSPQVHSEILETSIWKGQLLPVVSVGHPILKENKQDQIKKLKDYSCCLPKAFEGIEVCVKHPVFQKFSLEPSPNFLFDSYDVALEFVKCGSGWSFIPDLLIEKRKGLVALSHGTTWDAPYRISTILAGNRPKHPAIDLITTKLKAAYIKAFDK